MFYMIDNTKGLEKDDEMLLNISAIRGMDILTKLDSKNFDFQVHLSKGVSHTFAFNEGNMFNASQVMREISLIGTTEPTDGFIVISDVYNEDYVNKKFGEKSRLHAMICSRMIKISEITLVYRYTLTKEFENRIIVNGLESVILETPSEILHLIENANNLQKTKSKSDARSPLQKIL